MATLFQSSSRAARRMKRTHGGCPARFRHSLESFSATPLSSSNSNSMAALNCKLPFPQQHQELHRQASFHFSSSSSSNTTNDNNKSNSHYHRFRCSRHPARQFLQRRGFASKDTTDTDTTTSAAAMIDYFELFGVPRTFGMDASQLKQTYLKLMTEHHPDKQLHRPATDTSLDTPTAVTAETITHAYQILSAPHTRAQHWLELHGSPLVDDAPGSNDDNDDEEAAFGNSQNLVGMEFLLEILEWREAIEDAGSDQARLQAISQETQGLHRACERALEDLLEGVIHDNDMDDATLEDARQLTAQLQYWHRLERTLKDAMDVG